MIEEIYVNDNCKSLITNPIPINEGGYSSIYESKHGLVLKKFEPHEALSLAEYYDDIQKIKHISLLADNIHLLAPLALVYENNHLVAFLKKRSYGINLWNLTRTTPIEYIKNAFQSFDKYLYSIGNNGLLLDDLQNEILITPKKTKVLLEVADLEESINFQSHNTYIINTLELSKYLVQELFYKYYANRLNYLRKIECSDGELEAMQDIKEFLEKFFLSFQFNFANEDAIFPIAFTKFLTKLKRELVTYKQKEFVTLDDFDQALIKM